jgi:hypothetical protein
MLKKKGYWLGMLSHAYDFSYSLCKDQEDQGSRPAQEKMWVW